MSETKDSAAVFSGGATPTVTTKKVAPTGKKKVIRRLVKNAKTGEVIKTEIVRIDSNGETTITSYPAGTPVPSIGSLQASAGRKSSRVTSPERKENDNETSKPPVPRSDIGPSVPVNVPGLDDLLRKEKEMLKSKEMAQQEKTEKNVHEKKLDESLESTLISIARRKRQKDPKSRRRGLAASTMSRRADSDDNEDKDHVNENVDSEKTQTHDDEEEVKKRKERHRRRHEKRHREKPAAYRDKGANDSGIDGPADQRPYDPEDDEQELHPLEEAELLAKQLQASASLKQQKEAEASEQPEEAVPMDDVPSPVEVKPQMSDISDDDFDDKPKKKKKKHKNKKKKKKQKQKKRGGSEDELSDRSDKDKRSSPNEVEMKPAAKPDSVDESRKSRSKTKSRSRSRSSSYSSLSLSSISSDFSDSFDFAEVNPMAMGDNAMFRGGFRGRGAFNMPFRGRTMFRGFPRGRPPRGGFRGGWAGFPGMFPEGMDPMGNPMFMGRGARGMWPRGPWPMMGGRGGMNNVEEGGIGIYVEDESDNSRKRSRSYSSYSSYSSRSRSRSRRRHRRRHHSSSRSYSSYSRSSRSYSRSYSRSSRSYSRSYSRSTSRSYSSYSRSRSRSRSRGSRRGSSSERSDHFQDVYAQGANVEQPKQEEEVPWWAEFDKTYELQKKAEQEAKAQAKSQPAGKTSDNNAPDEASDSEPATKLQGTSYDFADMTKEDIDVVRTVMSLVDKTSHNQDPDVEDARRCVSELIQEVCSSQELQTDQEAAEECLNSILDQICPDDSAADRRDAEPNIPQFPEIADDENSKLLRWYTIACHVTKQTRAMRHQAKMLAEAQEKSEDDKDSRSESEQQRSSDRRGRRGRRRHRRRRHRGRSYSRSSYSSSSSEKRPSLVNLTTEQQQSLQQAQQMLILQQQQLQAAGILPKSLALPLPSLIPNLLPPTSTANAVPEPEVLSQRWDKDMDALLKTKSKDDITRKLMQRMKEKKQLGEADDSSPTFLARNKSSDSLATDKVFSGSGSLKSRKIAISSIDKSKVFGDDMAGYKKSDIAAAQASIEEASSKDFERLRELEQRGKLEAWSDEQKSLKEEVKRKMREEIEKAERAKKEKLKEQMLEEEKQKEIMRIREEVRQQIKQEIRDEIEKQRKQVLEDPELKSQLMELEALRQSKVSQSDSGTKPTEDSFVKEQDKHKQDMNSWLEKHGKRASEMGADEMRHMQMVYMQQLHHWSQQQQKAYMQWYWHQQQHFKQHTSLYNQSTSFYNQQSSANEPTFTSAISTSSTSTSAEASTGENPRDVEGNRGSTFTHAPSQGPPSDEMEGTTRSIPPRGLMSSHTDEQMRSLPPMQNRPPFSQPNQYNRNMPGNFSQNNEMMPRRSLPDHMMNQPRYSMSMRPPDMQRMRRPFQDPRDANQGPIHQYPPSDFDHRQDEFKPRMAPPVSGMHGQHQINRFERPPFDSRGAPRLDGQLRPRFDGHRPLHPSMDQRMTFDQRMRPPFDQQHVRAPFDQQQMRPPFNQQHMRPQFDQRAMRPRFDQQMRPEFMTRGQAPANQQGAPVLNQGPDGQFPPPGMNQPRFAPPPTSMNRPPLQPSAQVEDGSAAKLPAGNDQPPPPGVDSSLSAPQPIPSLAVAPPGVDELKPPGEETSPIPPPAEEAESRPIPSTTSKSSKKKKKKHRKHKKKRVQSSSSDDDDAQHAAILQQLEALQHVEDGEVVEVEDGEVQSDDGKKPSAIAAAAALLKQLKAKEKKRHKKKKKRRKETSSEEEEDDKRTESPSAVPASVTEGLPPPPFFPDALQPNINIGNDIKQGPPPMTHPPSHLSSADNISQVKPPLEESTQYPPRDYRSPPPFSHLQYSSTRYNLPPNPQGAGEPHPMERTEQHFTHFIGPGGDHTLGQGPEQKHGRSPLPISDDPRDLEMWTRQMRERYVDVKAQSGVKPLSDPNIKKIEKIPSLMDKFIPTPEPRRIASLARGVRHGRSHPDDDRMGAQSGRRKPDRGMRGRGRKRKRGMPPRNYHDWDQPADDGLIYYYSDSDNSSGWGSDKNFDDLLAKKKRENAPKADQDLPGSFSSPQPIHVTNTRRPSPGRIPMWDRMEHMGEPQGIPVIGGAKPQPIPSLANRNGPPPRNEYDHMGRSLNRESELAPDYWMMSDQQMMQRGQSQWDKPTTGVGHELPPSAPWLRPGMR